MNIEEATIGAYASLYGNKAAVHHFSKKLGVERRRRVACRMGGHVRKNNGLQLVTLQYKVVWTIVRADAKIKTKGSLAFSQTFAPAKISCYTV